ncbi:large-conductance mechanosensitive channel [Folsomia candida]|uniref:Large-conductance mechanosensitive channel n=1 Tax=Folsomia candida TaxID=158441 RepID=A0A226EEC5_FOLCA|nr:large-conductance mechanosensitive channel [Folsomia candida]XP_021952295.1 large-conductance mechanosensitive channel [Folsomia candida]XP_021952296.1 large-conductance mechanosensitive channel [Folsomia candida]XP_035707318.1 large-conductance mechanosensitive channel [Folsomia candida]XP_035707320.1 large-conductance mechanosensitive channel [Folsomia candida]XP_035707321.1 large-conductance mechanosensitive channel [Folsomia candida]XP_035707322.1 large-conductance mechanosensitive cha
MGFRDFLFRGNLIQLAVAVIIGVAFGNVVTALTQGMITPLLGIFGGQPKFSDYKFVVNGSEFRWGWVIDMLITFFITALVLYYVVVVPSDWVLAKVQKKEEDANRSCPECCSKISKAAKRCAFCTSVVIPPSPKLDAKGEGDAMIA